MVYLSKPYSFKFFKGYLPQILLGQFLNTLSYFYYGTNPKLSIIPTFQRHNEVLRQRKSSVSLTPQHGIM